MHLTTDRTRKGGTIPPLVQYCITVLHYTRPVRYASCNNSSWRPGQARPGQAHPHRGVNTRPGMFLAGSQLRLTSATTTLIEFYCYLSWQRPVINESQPTWTLTELLILLHYLVNFDPSLLLLPRINPPWYWAIRGYMCLYLFFIVRSKVIVFLFQIRNNFIVISERSNVAVQCASENDVAVE